MVTEVVEVQVPLIQTKEGEGRVDSAQTGAAGTDTALGGGAEETQTDGYA